MNEHNVWTIAVACTSNLKTMNQKTLHLYMYIRQLRFKTATVHAQHAHGVRLQGSCIQLQVDFATESHNPLPNCQDCTNIASVTPLCNGGDMWQD